MSEIPLFDEMRLEQTGLSFSKKTSYVFWNIRCLEIPLFDEMRREQIALSLSKNTSDVF